MARKRIGELLLEAHAITPAHLDEGLTLHRQSGQRLGVVLIQKGFITEEKLVEILGKALGIPTVDLPKEEPDWGAIHTLRPRFCESNDLFPYDLETPKGGRKALLVAMSDPLNLSAIEEIEFTTGLKVLPRLATLSSIRAAILRYYHKVNPNQADAGALVQAGGALIRASEKAAPPGMKPRKTGEFPAVGGGDEADEVIVGEELKEVSERTSLAELIAKREEQRKVRRKAKAASATGAKPAAGSVDQALSQDLEFLFGVRDEPEPIERLESKFWALMRIMARKGLITKDEFLKELDEDGED